MSLYDSYHNSYEIFIYNISVVINAHYGDRMMTLVDSDMLFLSLVRDYFEFFKYIFCFNSTFKATRTKV